MDDSFIEVFKFKFNQHGGKCLKDLFGYNGNLD